MRGENQHVQQEQNGAHCNGAVGYIEDGKGPVPMIDLNEIRDGAEDNAVIEIARRSAENECEPDTDKRSCDGRPVLPESGGNGA